MEEQYSLVEDLDCDLIHRFKVIQLRSNHSHLNIMGGMIYSCMYNRSMPCSIKAMEIIH